MLGQLSSVEIQASCDLLSPSQQVSSEVFVEPSSILLGASLRLMVVTRNGGADEIRAGYECGSGLGFEVTLPDGTSRYPLHDVPSICPMFDSNLLEPGERDTVAISWVPPARGRYGVRGGIKVPHGLDAASAQAFFEVR